MVAPDSFVTNVHPLFTLAGGFHNRAIHLDGGLFKERLVLLLPNPHANFVEGILQEVNVMGLEASAEVTGGRRIRNPLGSNGVEEEFVVASKFDVLQRRSSA